MEHSVKTLKLIPQILLWSIALTLIVLFVCSLLPSSGGGAVFMHDARLRIQSHDLILGLIIAVAVLLPSVRGTLRNLVIGDNGNGLGIVCGVTGLLLLLAAKYPHGSLLPRRPMLLVYIACLLLVPAFILILTRVFIRPYSPDSGGLLGDAPLETRDDLAPDQTIVLDNLKELLTKQQQIRSIGLYGDWGTGKTSVFQVARREIKQIDKGIIWVEIDPWRYTSQEALVLGFYEEIGKALERKIPGIQNSAAALLATAEPLVRTNDKTGVLATLFGWLQQLAQRQLRDPGEYITNLLKREGKYLVVTIDNVERNTDEQQVLRTLQLVHFLQGPVVAYVFISEKDKLLACIPNADKENAATYLEKFIEYELELFKPDDKQLLGFFQRKLQSLEKHDFMLNAPPRLIHDFATYRGVIKIFNQFTGNLDRFYVDEHYTVKLEDKLVLDHIRLKYPLLWRHIEQNRDLYDDGRRASDRLEYYLTDEDERDKRRGEAINKAVDEGVPENKQQAVRDTIAELFPLTNHPLGHHKVFANYEEWQREHKVAWPDALDDYFAGSLKRETYDAQLKKINDLLPRIATADDKKLIGHYRNYLTELGEEDKRDDIRLLTSEMLHREQDPEKAQQQLRALLRAYCQYGGYTALEGGGGGELSTILSAINRFAESIPGEADQAKALDYIFKDIEDYTYHPGVMLGMLLYMLPERDNHFFAMQRWGDGFTKLRRRGLKYVDTYYLGKGSKHTLFDTSRGYEWRFILFQWALSMRSSKSGSNILGAKARSDRVNKYVFGIWNVDHKLAYNNIKEDFWGTEWSSETQDAWHVSADKLKPYDTAKMVKLVEELTRSTTLSKVRRDEMAVFLEELKKVTDQPTA
jgi:hypothetical protein